MMKAEQWTPEQVREALPQVSVLFHHNGAPIEILCIVSGRKNKFATVRPFEFGSATEWTFSWDAIAHSLNTGNALRVD